MVVVESHVESQGFSWESQSRMLSLHGTLMGLEWGAASDSEDIWGQSSSSSESLP